MAQVSDEDSKNSEVKRDRLLQEYYDKQAENDQDRYEEYLKKQREAENQVDYRSPYIREDSLSKFRQIPDSLYRPGMDTLADSLLDSTLTDYNKFKMPDSLADTLKLFGYDLFDMEADMTMPSEVADIKSYVLGPGDEIYVFLWGKVEQQYELEIDREGKVFVPKIGEITAWGLTIGEFEEKLKQRLSKVYSGFNLSVSLGKIRTIRVYLTGEVKKPGAYTVSSLATLFNAMYLAEGPTPRGSLRKIRLVRSGKIEKEVDLYDFLLKGTSDGDVQLASGDAVFVPVAGPRIAVDGEINRPAIYEAKAGERVSDLVELAGGPTAQAYLDRVTLVRFSNENLKEIINITLNPETGAIHDPVVKSGDSLFIPSIYKSIKNYVVISGAVKTPSSYERTDSMTVRDLINMGQLQPRNVYYERANLFRKHEDLTKEIIPVNLHRILNGQDTVYLKDHDSLHIYRFNEINTQKYVYIEGEVKNPGMYYYYDNMTVNDLIFLAGDFTKKAYNLKIELARTDSLGNVSILDFDRTTDEPDRFMLQEDDYIFVREKPDQFLHQLVTVEGEVRFPGQYALISRDETLYNLIQRAGGFTLRAFPKGIIFYRESIGDGLIRQNLPSIIERAAPVREDSVGNLKRLEFIKFSPDNVNRIIINMEDLLKSEGLRGDVKLRGDDYIYVPRIPSGVSVMGAVGSEGTIKFERNRKVKHYVSLAGNFSRNADKGGIKLIKADGQVYSGGSTINKKVELGDAIVVPTEIKRDKDWLKTISTIFGVVGGALTTILVIDRL